jgi:plasmid maintenance system antidote protein VapI
MISKLAIITGKTAQRLSKAFGQSPQYWFALDENYRLRLKQNISDKIPRKFWVSK